MKRKPPKRSYRIVRHWSVSRGDFIYVAFQDTKWRDGVETTALVATGDREWAEKNAAHLEVEIQDAKLPVLELPLWLGRL